MASTGAKVLWTCLGLVGLVVLLFVGLFVTMAFLYRTEVVRYRHEPTRDLFKTYDLDAKKLAPCRAGKVVVSPRLVQGHPQVTLFFLSKEQTSLTLRRVTVKGVGSKAAQAHPFELGLQLALDTKTRKGELFKAAHTLELPLSSAEYDSLASEGLVIVVELTLADGAEAPLELHIERAVTMETVWPT